MARLRPVAILVVLACAHALLLWHLHITPLRNTLSPAAGSPLIWVEAKPATLGRPPATTLRRQPVLRGDVKRRDAQGPHRLPAPWTRSVPAVPTSEESEAPEASRAAVAPDMPAPAEAAAAPTPLRLPGHGAAMQSPPALSPAQQAIRHGQTLAAPGDPLSRQIGRAAKGNCIKGEYAGSGGGLASIPAFALAMAKGECAR